MAVRLEDIIAGLSDEELKSAFYDITEWRKTGVLKMDSVIRQVQEKYIKESNHEIPIWAMETPFLYEMAKRKYANNE